MSVSQMLKNNIYLVTGSSRGIGKEIALTLARQGASIILNAATSVEEARAVLVKLPRVACQQHLFLPANVEQEEDIVSMMEKIQQRYGYLNGLINNAGSTQFVDHPHLNDLSTSLIDKMYRLHFRAPLLCAKYGTSLLKEGQVRCSVPSHIVHIASIAATTAIGSNIAYCAMKAAVLNLTQSLARSLAPAIHVNAVSPGLTETSLTAEWHDYKADQRNKTPLERLASPKDVADAVFALLTSLRYTVGQNIIVDGGRSLHH